VGAAPERPGGAPPYDISGAQGTAQPAAAGGVLPRAKDGAPWHFKLLVVGVTVYMVYRIYWLVEWLPKHI
jgi:hypothetical protein